MPNFLIVLFKNKTKKKIINKFMTEKRANEFFNNLIVKSDNVVFERNYENGVRSDYELAILKKTTSKIEDFYIKDELGRQVKVDLDDDGYQVEPEFYLPIIPYIAVNGCIGIGTGFSTDIPSYNPAHIVSLLRARLTERIDTIEGRQLDPWWFGFKGRISRRNDNTWITHGIYEFNDEDNTVVVTELPIGRWANDYKAFLDAAAIAEEEAKAVNKKE
jgi:hypothetical protein